MLTKENHTGIREIIGEFFYNLEEGTGFLNLTKSESSKRNLTSKICRKKCILNILDILKEIFYLLTTVTESFSDL